MTYYSSFCSIDFSRQDFDWNIWFSSTRRVTIRAIFWARMAAVKPKLSLSQTTSNIHIVIHASITICISICVNWVTVFKLLIYSVNIKQHQLLYVVSLWFLLKKMSTLYCSGMLLAGGLGGLQPSWNLRNQGVKIMPTLLGDISKRKQLRDIPEHRLWGEFKKRRNKFME